MTRKRISSIIIGLVILAVGVILIGNATGIWEMKILFDGWWAAALMLAFLVSIVGDRPNVFNVGGLVLFGILLLKKCGVIPEKIQVWAVALAAVIILIGLRIIFPRKACVIRSSHTVSSPEGDASGCFCGSESVSFGEQKCVYTGKEYNGGTFSASFGSLTLDLRGAQINEKYTTRLTASFGEVCMLIDPDVRIELTKSSFFGSVDWKNNGTTGATGERVLHVDADASFGEVKIKV